MTARQRTDTQGKAHKHRWRVLVVDDHPTVRRGMSALMEEQRDMTVCGEVGDIASALAAARELEPDLLLVDLSLGGESGLDLIREHKALSLPGRVLAVSIHDESMYAEQVLHAGASGYLNKQSPLEEIIEAARRVLDGKVYLSATLTDRVLHQVASGSYPGEQDPVQRLSDRELEVYQWLGRGLSTRQIAERLGLSMKTIETYREHIKAKLNVNDSNRLICYAARWVADSEKTEEEREEKAGVGV